MGAVDTRPSVRLRQLKEGEHGFPHTEENVKETKRATEKIKRQQRRAKYDTFYDIEPIMKVITNECRGVSPDGLRDAAMMLIRMETMGRSNDIAQMRPHIYITGGKPAIILMDKLFVPRLLTIARSLCTMCAPTSPRLPTRWQSMPGATDRRGTTNA